MSLRSTPSRPVIDSTTATVVLRASRMVMPVSSELERTPLPRIPHRLGNYEIRRELGRGGMGIVYEGFDPVLRRTVAVKVLKDARDVEFLTRFRTEAEAVAQLQHPHIVQVYEVGTHDDAPFVALEFLPGGSLHQKIAGMPQPPQLAAERVRDLASAAAHAHQHGVVHRDLKPANVLFTESGQPKITDFGAARMLSFVDGNYDPGLTQAGEVIGTPQYMPPEQAGGLQEEIGPTADVYALGAILYELLTGRPPFTGVDPFDVIHSVRTQDPIPPRKLRGSIPRDLETICLKCLEKNPLQRYQTAEALHEDLIRYLAGDSILARPAGLGRRLWLRARRRPTATGLIVGLVAAGLIGIITFIWQFTQTAAALDIARENEHRANLMTDAAKAAKNETEIQKTAAVDSLEKSKWNHYTGSLTQAGLFSQQGRQIEAAQVLLNAPKDHLNWEWYNQLRQTSDVLWQYDFRERHPEAEVCWVNKLELSPDGTKVAVSLIDPYEKNNKKQIVENPPHLAIVNVKNGRMHLWMPHLLPTWIAGLYWLNDQELLVTDWNSDTRIINVSDGRTVAHWPPAKLEANSVSFASEAKLLLRSVNDGSKQLELIDLTRRRTTRKIPAPGSFLNHRSISPDGRFAFFDHSNEIQQRFTSVIRLDTNEKVCQWNGTRACLNFSHDSRFAVTAYAAEDAHHRHYWRRNSNEPWKRIASAPGNRPTCTVTLWDTATWTPIWTRHHHSAHEGLVVFAPDDSRVAIYNDDSNAIVCYDTATGMNAITMRGHESVVRDVRFSPDGLRLLSACDDRTVRVWDIFSGSLMLVHRGHEHTVRQAVFSNDGRRIISGGADELLDCLDLSRPTQQGGIMPPHLSGGGGTRMGTIAFTPRGTLLVLNTERGIIEFDPSTGNPIVRRSYPRLALRDQKEMTDFSFSADGQRFSGRMQTISWFGEKFNKDVGVWDVASEKLTRQFFMPYGKLYVTAISPDGQTVIASGFTETIKKIHGETKKEIKTYEMGIIGWDVSSGREKFHVKTNAPVLSLAFSPDGSEFAAGFARPKTKPGCAICFYDSEGRIKDKGEFQDPPQSDEFAQRYAYVNALSYSPDGRWLGGTNWAKGGSFVLDRQNITLKHNWIDRTPTSVVFSPDSSRFVTTGYDDVIRIYDVAKGQQVANLQGALGRVDDHAFPAQVRFSQDGRTLAATHWDGQLSIWHVDSLSEEGIDPNRQRELADLAAYRFHLDTARKAAETNDSLAYRIQVDVLKKSNAPTPALADDWKDLQAKYSPENITQALVGGWPIVKTIPPKKRVGWREYLFDEFTVRFPRLLTLQGF